jgi:serine O-acetyltransferase
MTKIDYIQQKARVLSQTIEWLLPGYECEDGRNPITECAPLPSEAEVIRVLKLIDSAFFPGFREERAAGGCALDTHVTERLDEAYDILYRQVLRALPFRRSARYCIPEIEGYAPLAPEELEQTSEELVGTFFTTLPRVRELLKTDVAAAYAGDPAAQSDAEVILSYPTIRAITIHRLAHELYKLDVPVIPRMMNEWIHARTGIDIHPGATIGESFFIDHGTGVVIGETTVIGSRVKLYQGVGLVGKSTTGGQEIRGLKRHPTVEDEVVIYAGATILGGDTVIGRGSTINANVFVTRSVPPGTTVTRRSEAAQPEPPEMVAA